MSLDKPQHSPMTFTFMCMYSVQSNCDFVASITYTVGEVVSPPLSSRHDFHFLNGTRLCTCTCKYGVEEIGGRGGCMKFNDNELKVCTRELKFHQEVSNGFQCAYVSK